MADLVQVSQVEFYKQRLEVNMSSILKGADKAYLREYNESEDERRLDALQDSIGSIRKATKGGKYLGSDVIDIMVQVQGFAEKLGIDPDELDYAENQVREAMNNLESAIYGLEEPFEDAIRSLQNKIDDSQVDEMYDEKAFDNIFKDRKDKGSMEKPKSKSLPKDTGMYNQSNKAERDKRENDNIDEEKQRLDPKCWDGYKKQGTKMKGDKRVNNCVKAESRILQGLTEGLNTPTPFQIVQDVYKNKQHQKIDGVVMDLFTASALVNAYNQINDANKKKMENADIAMLGKMASKIFELSESMELEEGNGKIRMGILGMLLVAGIWKIDRNMAEKVWDNSHQLQQLTQVYAKANECGDKEKMKDVKRRIANHKTRLDIGKGDVDFDGLPGKDDIKDIGYATQSCEVR